MNKIIQVLTLLAILILIVGTLAKLNHWYGAELLIFFTIPAMAFLVVRFILNIFRLLKRSV